MVVRLRLSQSPSRSLYFAVHSGCIGLSVLLTGILMIPERQIEPEPLRYAATPELVSHGRTASWKVVNTNRQRYKPPVALGLTRCAEIAHAGIAPIVARVSQQYGIAEGLLRAVIWRESRNHSCATSKSGAAGLMQLMPITAKHFGVTDVYDPEQNIEGGAKYLRWLLQRYKGNLRLALAAYNGGAGTVDNLSAVPLKIETEDYLAAILQQVAEESGNSR